jgi:hypothetical protein
MVEAGVSALRRVQEYTLRPKDTRQFLNKDLHDFSGFAENPAEIL